MTSRTLLTGLLAAACVPAAASADFTGASVEDVSDLVCPPPGLTTYRVYVHFDSPDDQLLAISGNQDVAGLFFSTSAEGLVNAGGPLAGLKLEDFAASPVSLPWDSWVTIDHEVLAGNDTDYSPGFLGGYGVHAVIVGTSWSQADNGGWFDSNPQSPAVAGADLRVLIAQFTIEEGHQLELWGTVDYYPDGSPPSQSEFFSVTWPPYYSPCDEVRPEHVSTSPPTDLDGSGMTEFGDLLAVLSAWGPCTPSFEITAQRRSYKHLFGYCPCTGTWTIADGFGSWDHASGSQYVHTSVRDDGVSFDGTAVYDYGSMCHWEEAWGGVRFQFQVNVPLPFTLVADAEPDGEAGSISLTGPGLDLTDPIDTAGILAPGQYVLDAHLVCYYDYYYCGAAFDYDLVLDGTRCAADVDRDGLVDWRDLLQVLSEWGLTVQPGACCLPDGTCADTVAYDDCVAAGGVPAGWGTRCDTDPCAPFVFVACCLLDGTCFMTTNPEDCLAVCGTPQGAGSACATCPQPGACCLPSGGCEETYVGSLGEQFCMSLGGVYLGDDVPCTDAECPESGACCLPDGSCVPSANGGIDCADQGGVYHGDDTLCADVVCTQPGACCLPDGTCIQADVSGNACANLGGVYHGDDTLCADVVCIQPGACCLPDGSCAQSDVGGDACADQGGVYQGDDTLCADVVCPQPGACCLLDGSCVQSDVGGSVCTAQGGVYQGDDTLCADVVCPQPGACCLLDGSCVQSDVGGSVCADQGGVYQGDDTLCADVVCPQPGACCLLDGSCVQSDVGGSVCADQGGVYLGDDTLCADVVCLFGACCFPDWTCAIHTEESCANAGGTFAGAETTCAVVNCAQGACCLPDGSCFVLTSVSCDGVGGTYQGGGSTCESCP